MSSVFSMSAWLEEQRKLNKVARVLEARIGKTDPAGTWGLYWEHPREIRSPNTVERYVPVSKLHEWFQRWVRQLPNSSAIDLCDLVAAALTPEAITREHLLATLKRYLESAESEHAAETATVGHESERAADQRPSEPPATLPTGVKP